MGQEKGSSTEVKENGLEFAGEKCRTGQKRGVLEFIGELFINHSFPLITEGKSKGRIHWAISHFYIYNVESFSIGIR